MDNYNGPVSDSLTSSLCETCKGLDPINALAGISTWASDEGRVLGTKDQLKMKECPLCKLILTAIASMYLVYPDYQPQGLVTCKLNSNPPCFSVRDSKIGSGIIQMKREDAIQARRNAGLEKTKSTQDEGIEDQTLLRPVQRDQINASIVRSWGDSCIRDHGYHCCPGRHNTPRDDLEIKLLLIDVKEKRIVERIVTGKQEVDYIALSYVWGQVKVLQTVRSNLAKLQRHGALDSGNTSIPQVIIDAMTLVEVIGNRYLWVDALCIIQDSPDKAGQLQIMDLIYMRARLTIIAMAGKDANCGLPGIKPGTRKQQPTEVIDGCTFMAQLPELYIEAKISPHFTRGWTYQEMMLSPRCLFVSPYQLHFRCNSRVFAEDCHGKIDQFLCDQANYSLLINGDIDDFLLGYQQCVAAYTRRSLTYDDDIINAFSGILNELSSRFQVSFHAAIPEKAISRALLWCPVDSAEKRFWTNKPLPPSWSWVSWKGPIIYEIWDTKIDVEYRPLLSGSIRTKCPGETEFRDIQGRTDEEQGINQCKGRECLVFLGEKRLDDLEGRTRKYHVDSSRPSASLLRRRSNPHPQSNGAESSEINHLTILQFRVSTIKLGRLHLGEPYLSRLANGADDPYIGLLPIYDEKNRLCGGFPSASMPTIAPDQVQHLRIIAISSSSALPARPYKWVDPHFYPDMMPDGKLAYWKNPKLVCECILRIMLIEVHGDIAERVAVGLIHPKAWAKESPRFEEINLA